MGADELQGPCSIAQRVCVAQPHPACVLAPYQEIFLNYVFTPDLRNGAPGKIAPLRPNAVNTPSNTNRHTKTTRKTVAVIAAPVAS